MVWKPKLEMAVSEVDSRKQSGKVFGWEEVVEFVVDAGWVAVDSWPVEVSVFVPAVVDEVVA